MVMVLFAKAALKPAGKPLEPETPVFNIPVAPVVAIVIFVNAVLIHSVGVLDAALAVLAAVTVIVPVAFTLPHPPVNGMLELNVPVAVGVPLMVMVLLAKAALTPAGKPLEPETPAFEIPVAPVVAIVIFVNAALIHMVGVLDAALAVFAAVTVIVPVAFTLPQPPVNGML
jgi:hypothetical protein